MFRNITHINVNNSHHINLSYMRRSICSDVWQLFWMQDNSSQSEEGVFPLLSDEELPGPMVIAIPVVEKPEPSRKAARLEQNEELTESEQPEVSRHRGTVQVQYCSKKKNQNLNYDKQGLSATEICPNHFKQ